MIEFKKLLNDNATPEFANHVFDLLDLLNDLGETSIGSTLMNLVDLRGNIDSDSWLGEVESFCANQLNRYLSSQQVTLVATLPESTDILRGLSTLSDIGESEYLYTLCSVTENAEICLAEMLEYVTGKSSDYYIPLLEHVGDSLIDSLMSEFAPTEKYDVALESKPISGLDLLKALCQANPELLIVDAMRIGLKLGGRLETYIHAFKDDLLQEKPARIALELIAFALAADAPAAGLYETIAPHLETFISDPGTITKVAVALRKACEEYNGQA